MKQVLYVMQFKGQAGPVEGKPAMMKASTKSPSWQATSVVGQGGVQGTLTSVDGDEASFESNVYLTGDTSFQEDGTIRFGGNSTLRFSTVGEGYLGSSPDPKLKHGSVIWKIDSGEGQFAGATGLITSNFTVGDQGEVTDNHFGVIFVR